VVQNEKRQGENQPYGRAFNHITKATYPEEHPYGHTVIGEMADLNAASLEDVREWFRAWYGPSNAVIVLAGDITPEEAKAKVERYFGDIPPGAPVAQPKRWIAKRTGAQREVMEDRVAQPRLYKVWNVPELGSEDSDRLSMVADLLSSGRSSRLYKRLVHEDQTATGVNASNGRGELGSRFIVTVTAKPGQDLRVIEKVVDEEMARLFRDGPTAAELERVRAENLGSLIRGFERIGGFGGKSDLLAASEVYQGSPDAWKTTVERFRTATGPQLREVGRQWLTDGSYTLEVVPFGSYAAAPTGVDRKTMPQPGQVAAPAFPAFQRATLSNGLKVIVASRRDAPVVNFNLLVDAGNAANPAGKPGTALLASNLLTQGTERRDSFQISDELMLLGATLNAGNTSDATSVGMNTLKATLDRSLALYADVIQNPAFREADVERQRRLQLASIAQEKRSPGPAALRVLPTAIYGPNHPYAAPASGTEASVASITRADLTQFHENWFKPNQATLVVVGDTTLAEIQPKLEAAFAGWRPGAAPARPAIAQPGPVRPMVYIVDQPGAVQTQITAGLLAPPKANPDEVAFETLNTLFGGAFTSRVNLNLREAKGWSYGARSQVRDARGPRLFYVSAPVQTDKTKESLVEVRKELRDILKDRVVTSQELSMAQDNRVLGLPGRWETNAGVQASLADIVTYGLPDDYYSTYTQQVRAGTTETLTRVAGQVIRPDSLTWVIVGDRSKIEADVRSLNLGEVRIVDADGRPVS
jgi:zinc protease